MKKIGKGIPTVTKKNYQFLIGLLITIIVLSFVLSVIQRNNLFIPYDPQHWEDEYNSSQWMVKNNPRIITDEALYTHVSGLLINGHDPSLINAEVPPFGKYVIGFFNKTTGMLGIYGVVFSAISLFLFFILNKIIFRSSLIALLPVVIFSFDPIFKEQIAVGLLDSLYLSLLFLSFIFFLKKKYIATAIILGFFMATKSPFLIVVVYALLLLFLFSRKELKVRRVIYMGMITLFIYVVTHIQLFLLGHNLQYFLSVQKYMIHFYQVGAKGVFGAVIPLLLSGYWFTWYGDNQFIKNWSLIWPLVSVGGVAASYSIVKDRLFTSPFFFILLWCLLYFGFLCITPVFPRYLLLLLPFLYNLSIWFLFRSYLQK